MISRPGCGSPSTPASFATGGRRRRCRFLDQREPNKTSRAGCVADESGATIVEFGVIAWMVFLTIFLVIEAGLAVRAGNAVADAAEVAARRGAIATNAVLADYHILGEINQSGVLQSANVDYVVIFRSENGKGPTAQCRQGSPVLGECNVYHNVDGGADWLDPDAFGCVDELFDGSWCPRARASSIGESEYVGVWIEARHRFVLLSAQKTLNVAAASTHSFEIVGI